MNHRSSALLVTAIFCLPFSSAEAVTYNVGDGEEYTTLQEIADQLEPGDTVLVDGNNDYPSDIYIEQSGTADQWITIRGVRSAGGTRPLISERGSYGINISADYIILEGFSVTGQPKGIGVFGNNIKVRDCIISNCNHGLIGYGTGTGNITVEYCEFFGNGVPTGGATQHQIYMATDQIAHPGAIFRLQHCYLHDGVEGDNVKSRAERNEIYYNWIENAGTSGHGLGLFAPDPEDNGEVEINTAREDADVVGNVIIQQRNSCARIGGDTPGYSTNGRYRFVNNTFILEGTRGDVIRTFNVIETLEMYNNVIYGSTQGADIRVVNDADGDWVHSPRSLKGSHNWVINGAARIPGEGEWSSTITGSSSPFVNAAAHDFRPAAGSGLINAGTDQISTIDDYEFENPLFPPAFHPPVSELLETGSAQNRPVHGIIDIGAFEEASTGIIKLSMVNRKFTDAYRTYNLNGRVCRMTPESFSGLRVLQSKGNTIRKLRVR